jgi:hypothetical protein
MKQPVKGLLVTTEGDCRMVVLERSMDINHFVGCEFFDIVRLGNGADMFVDDEGLLSDRQANLVASAIAVMVTGKPYEIVGDALILGGNDETGETCDCPAWIRSLVSAEDTQARQFVSQVIAGISKYRNQESRGIHEN